LFIPDLAQTLISSADPPHLVVHSGGDLIGEEGIVLPPSARLEEFLARAADVGLSAPEAVRIAIERWLVLSDIGPFGLDVETCRRILGRESGCARASRQLTPRQASWVRKLCAGQPVPVAEAGAGLTVAIPGRLLTRAAGQVPARALHASVVAEMLSWEIAATLEGRTMGEWALRTLSSAVAA
jgi:hypothetical protein